MPKVKVKIEGKELSSGVIEYISMVTNPASRAPFRVTKSEETQQESEAMHQQKQNWLGRMFKQDGKEATPAPSLVAVVIEKAQEEELKPLLESAGISVSKAEEVDNIILYKQEDYNEETVTPIKCSNGITCLVENVQKGFSPYIDSPLFKENLEAGGFFPSLYNATESLLESFSTILRASGNPEEAKPAINLALSDFSSYVSTLTDTLPSVAFKLDDLDIPETLMKGDKGKDKKPPKKPYKTTKNDNEEAAMSNSENEEILKNEEDSAAEGETSEANEETEATGNDSAATGESADVEATTESTEASEATDGAETVAKSEEVDPLAELMSVVKGIAGGMNELKTEMADVRKGQESLESKVEAVETVAKSAKDAVDGFVPGGSDGADSTSTIKETTKKSEGSIYDGSQLDFLSR